MAKESILVVDDERDILELVEYNLSSKGFNVTMAESGERALSIARAQTPDLILLDLMLPGLDGLEVCRALKSNSRTSSIPVIMLTAKGEEGDIVSGLEIGADDYITKPFSPRVLMARIRAVLRRKNEPDITDKSLLKKRDMIIDPERFKVTIKDKEIKLTLTEFKVLHMLASREGMVFTRYQIVDATKGDDYIVTDRAVDVQIVGLRRKLGKYGKYIETVRGVGYKFEVNDD